MPQSISSGRSERKCKIDGVPNEALTGVVVVLEVEDVSNAVLRERGVIGRGDEGHALVISDCKN